MARQSISGDVIFDGIGQATLHIRLSGQQNQGCPHGGAQDGGGVHVLRRHGEIAADPGAAAMRPPSGRDAKDNVDSGVWPAVPDKANKSPAQFAAQVNNIQRRMFGPPYGAPRRLEFPCSGGTSEVVVGGV